MGFPRDEMEDMVRRWTKAGEAAEAANDWASHLGPFYADDARCYVVVGPNNVYSANNATEIRRGLLGHDMIGFEGWTFPQEHLVIDDQRGTVSIYWRQVSPFTRPDGSRYELASLGNTFFRYAGNYQWSYHRDLFDLSQINDLFVELAADGHLSSPLKRRIQAIAWGQWPDGYQAYQHKLDWFKKVRGYFVLGRVAMLGW